jgi:predicted phosphodiesterase
MASNGADLIIGLGDYRYNDGERHVNEFWNDIVMPNKGSAKWYGAFGNHDDENSKFYLNKFDQSGWIYSFDSNGTHFLAINPLSDYKKGSDQYDFVQNDLKKASANPNIKWKVVFMHHIMYASCSVHCPESELRDTYQPLFDQYGVDLVLQGHNHNYQRTYPVEFNASNPDSPTITSAEQNNYADPDGQVYLTVGTGGREAHSLDSTVPEYLATQFTDTIGYIDISLLNNGTMSGVYYSDDGDVKDQFTIKKGDV